ncbi:MAG: hypothetical protein Q9157_006502 [Trypethelium eluteriae]
MLYLAILCLATCIASSSTHARGEWEDGLNFRFPNVTSPQPFNISVEPAFVNETLTKVSLYRPSRDIFSTWTNEGPARANITELASYWATDYDWFHVQDQINSNFSHYATSVTGIENYTAPVPLHFVHERSADPDAIPLLLLHGWPSTHLEWQKVIKPLSSQAGNVSFHVVAPDLPGYGFSPAPTQPMTVQSMGYAMDALMRQLGYDKYGIVSTDLGWFVGLWMVADVGSNVIGHFSDFWFIQPNATDLARFANNETTPEETDYINTLNAWTASHEAYLLTHSTKPLAISLAMSDSPVGFAGWAWDLIRTVSGGYVYETADIITSTMMLYIQGTHGNIRLYLEAFKPSIQAWPATTIPTAVSEWSWAGGPFPELANAAAVSLDCL